MEKQSGGEFASTDAAAGAQDAALQELWLSAEIPVEPCSRLQHLQRPTPSHLGSDTPDATRRGDENMARGRRSDVRIPVANGSTTLASPQRDNTARTVDRYNPFRFAQFERGEQRDIIRVGGGRDSGRGDDRLHRLPPCWCGSSAYQVRPPSTRIGSFETALMAWFS